MAGSIVQTATGNGSSDTTCGVTFSSAPASGNKVILAIGRRAPTTDTNSSFSPSGGAQRGGQAGSTADNNCRVFEWTGDGTTTTFSVTFDNARTWAAIGYEASGLGAFDVSAVSTTATATSRSSGTTATLANSSNFTLAAGASRNNGLTGGATNATVSLVNHSNSGSPSVRTTTTAEWRTSTGSTTGVSDTITWDGSNPCCAGVWVWQEAAAVNVIQDAFRFRGPQAASVGLNTAFDGSDPAIDTDVTWAAISRRFRYRTRIRNTGGSVSQAYKLQYRINAGSWTDVHVNGAGHTRTLTSPVELWPNSGYADGDTTTELTAGPGTFVSGRGKDTSITTASITLGTNQETELEWSLALNRYWDSGQFADGDTVDLRVVTSAGVALSGGYGTSDTNIGRVTIDHNIATGLAQGAGHLGGIWSENPGDLPILWNENDHGYWLCEVSETFPDLMMLKTTDGGVTWNQVDQAGNPATTDFEGATWKLVGDTIHIAHHAGGGTDRVRYHRFHTSSHGTTPDEWDATIIDEDVYPSFSDQRDQQSVIARRSDGTVVIAFTGPDATTPYEVRLAVRSAGGTWGTPSVIWDGGTTGRTGVVGVQVGDDLVLFAHSDDDGDIDAKVWTSSDTLVDLSGSSVTSSADGTQVATNGGTGLDSEQNMVQPVFWNDGANKVAIAWVDNTSEDLLGRVITAPGTGSVSLGTIWSAVNDAGNIPRGLGQSRQPTAALAVDTSNGDLYAVFARETTTAGDNTLYYDVSTDDGATWGTNTALTLRDQYGSRHNWVRAAVNTVSATKALRFVYDNANLYEQDADAADAQEAGTITGHIWYDELELSAPSFTGSGTPTEAADTSTATGTYTPPDITGSGTPTEANDTSSGSGTYTPQAITGSGTPSEVADTSAGTGTHAPPAITGSGAPTEANDTSAGSGTLTNSYTATGSPSEAPDTSSGSGTFQQNLTGSGSPTESEDTSAGSGTYQFLHSGSGTPTEAADAGTGVGTYQFLHDGSGAPTEDDDTSSGTGAHTPPNITGSGTPSEEEDTSSGTGVFQQNITGTGTPTEDDDTSTGSGNYQFFHTGSGTPTEAADTSSGVGTFGFTGSGTPAESADTSAGTGTYQFLHSGSGTPAEGSDTSSGTGTFTSSNVTGSGTPSENEDTSSGSGTFTTPQFSGSGTPTEGSDTSAGSGTLAFIGAGTPTEGADTSTGSGAFTIPAITGSGSPTEANDTSAGTGRGGTIEGVDDAPWERYHFWRVGASLVLVPSHKRIRRGGWSTDDNTDLVSSRFRANVRIDPSELQEAVASAWATHAGSSTATLLAAIDTDLNLAGVKKFDGTSLV